MNETPTTPATIVPGSKFVSVETQSLRFDDVTIEREASYFPEALREPYVWVKTYTREECTRDLNVLTERAKSLGITFDKTTWSRILRAKWNRDANGQERLSPITSIDSLSDAIAKLRAYHKSGSLRGRVPFIMTSVAQDIFSYIDLKRSPDRVNRFGIVVGHTGSQKTSSFKEYERQRNHGNTLWLEAPENAATGELISRMSAAFGYSETHSSQKKRAYLLNAIKPHRCIIVDNVQDMFRRDRAEQPAFSFLRRLQDETGCCIILSITPTFERALMRGMIEGYFEQFEGRSGGRDTWLRLPDYPPDDDVIQIASAFGMPDPETHRKALCAIAHQPGRIRRLFEVLQQAKIYASASKQPLTIDHIRDAQES